MNTLAVEVAMRWVPEALKRDIDLGFEACPEPVRILGEPDRLRELLNNLVDNAVRYSRRSGRVREMRSSDIWISALTISIQSARVPVVWVPRDLLTDLQGLCRDERS